MASLDAMESGLDKLEAGGLVDGIERHLPAKNKGWRGQPFVEPAFLLFANYAQQLHEFDTALVNQAPCLPGCAQRKSVCQGVMTKERRRAPAQASYRGFARKLRPDAAARACDVSFAGDQTHLRPEVGLR
jgi:hypothetical protein